MPRQMLLPIVVADVKATVYISVQADVIAC